MSSLEANFHNYLIVSQAWNGTGQSITVNQAIKLLEPIANHEQNLELRQRAQKLLFHIVYGREPKRRVS